MLAVAIAHFPRAVSCGRERILQNAENRAWQRHCALHGMSHQPQRVVYILKNADTPPRFYTGITADLKSRLEAHNAGRCRHTAKHRPWVVDVAVKFADEARALKFEKYLKSGSSVEFAGRHLR